MQGNVLESFAGFIASLLFFSLLIGMLWYIVARLGLRRLVKGLLYIVFPILIPVKLASILARTLKRPENTARGMSTGEPGTIARSAQTSPHDEAYTRHQYTRPTASQYPLGTPTTSSPGLKQVMEITPSPLPDLKSGYGCTRGWSIRLTGFTPQNLDGQWECCRLGCGGWGCAYKCSRGWETVVMKVPRGFESVVEGGEAPSVSVRFMERLVEKAEALSLLRHSHIVRLAGYHRHIPLLVYEYAPYGSLEWQLQRGWDPSLGDALLVGLQVGDALRYIHSRGLVHGDIKPGNVFIGGERWAKVGDFSGLVRLLSKSSRTAMPRQYTLGFRAPEQVFSDLRDRAKAAGLENRIDVYQLGNLILYLATGDTVDGEEYTEVDEKLAEIRDPRLQGLLRLMLAKDPLERPSIEQVLPRLAEIYRTIAIK